MRTLVFSVLVGIAASGGVFFGFARPVCHAEEEGVPPAAVASGEGPAAGLPWTVPELGLEFIYVREGSFRMGNEDETTGAVPVRPVRITRGFWLAEHELSQKAYRTLTGKNPSRHQGDRKPVERVTWHDAVAFCRALTDRERMAGRLPAGYQYRLPTEAEWEYAARGGADGDGGVKESPSAKEQLRSHLKNHGDSTHPVAAGKPTRLGFHGMSGNVWEWCLDWHGEDYHDKSPVADPTGPRTGTLRVSRGGLIITASERIRPLLIRDPDPPDNVDDFLGFRPALGPALQGTDPDRVRSEGPTSR